MNEPPPHEQTQSVIIRVPGADCSWCFNEAIEQVLQLDGVSEIHGSITSACLEVTGPGFSAAELLDTFRIHLHGTDNSSHECQMTPVAPQLVTPVHEQVEPKSPAPGSDRTIEPMETLTQAMQRLRGNGFVHDLQATLGGQLRCGTCGSLSDPESATIAETIRFEGDSNPDDEAILIAIVCPGGCLGQFSSAFGPTASAPDTEVLQRLTHIATG